MQGISFGDEVREMEVSYNESEITFRVPIVVADASAEPPKIAMQFEVPDDGDDGLRIMTADGTTATDRPVEVPSSGWSDDVDRTLYKFVATSETGATFDGPMAVEVVLYVDGEEVDRKGVTFWNTIRAY